MDAADQDGRKKALLAVLLAATMCASIAFPFLLPAGPVQTLPAVDPGTIASFPRFNRSDTVFVVNITGLLLSDQLTLVSLQGLVNRVSATIYVDFDTAKGENYSWLGPSLDWRHVSYSFETLDGLLRRFNVSARGLVVYDEARPQTVNLATTMAGLEDLLVCNATRAPALSASYGLPVVEDLTAGEWAAPLSTPDFYMRAFERYYPRCEQSTLAMFPPEATRTRDWAVARRLFCYFLSPGPIADPAEVLAFEQILKRSPKATTLVGWMRWELGIEENFGMQVISRSGKVLFPCESVPNFSFLGSISMSGPSRSVIEPPPPPAAGNKTYLCFLMSDGDNPDYLYIGMREKWSSPLRGSLPIGWGMPPGLAEVAPTMLEYYYRTATPNDTFVAGSSGAAIVYPDFYPEDRLPHFLNRTRALMDKSGLESVWLINSYTPYETPYSKGTLTAFADYLHPTGIFLDYGDVPVSKPWWIQNGRFRDGVPVVRSFHMWGSLENFVAKVLVDARASGNEPYFIFVTVHVWTMGLENVVEAVEQLRASELGERLEVVPPATLLKMIQGYSVRKASGQLDGLRGDRLLSVLASAELSRLDRDLSDARAAQESNDLFKAAGLAADVSDRVEELRTESDTALAVLAALVIIIVLLFLLWLAARGERDPPPEKRAYPLLVLFPAAMFLFLQGQFRIFYGNFWDWAVFGAVIPAALIALPFAESRRLGAVDHKHRLLAAAAILLAASALEMLTMWAAAAAAFAFVWLMREAAPMAEGGAGRAFLLGGSFALSCALLNMVGTGTAATGIACLWLLFGAVWAVLSFRAVGGPLELSGEEKKEEGDQYPLTLPGIFLTITASSLYLTRKHYLTLQFGGATGYLLNLSVMIPLAAFGIAFLLSRLLEKRKVRYSRLQPLLLALFGLGWLGVALIGNNLASSMFLLLAESSLMLIAIQALRKALSGRLGEARLPYLMRNLVPFFIAANMLLLLPILSYNLYLGSMPVSFNYLLYVFPLAFAIFTFAGLLPFAVATYHFHKKDRPGEE